MTLATVPQLERNSGRLPRPRDILALFKPVTWFPPMWAFGCGLVSAGVPLDGRWWLPLVGVALTGPLVCGTSQAVNDWFDRDIDAINEPQRPIPSGRIAGRWGLGLAVLGTVISLLRSERRAWAGELTLRTGEGGLIPLAVRGEPVPGESGDDLGCVLFATDLRAQRDAEASRRRVHDVMLEAQRRTQTEALQFDPETAKDFGEMIDTILSNARRAMSSGARASANAHPATMASVEALTRRAAALALQLEGYTAARRQRGSS